MPTQKMVTANGQPIDAHTHIFNDQAWRARQPHDLHHELISRADDPRGSLSRVGPQCFRQMVQGERYPSNFKCPKEVDKYEPSLDLVVWIDTYRMAMGIVGQTDPTTTRYLTLMIDRTTKWINTFPPNNNNSWEDMRDTFVEHFKGSYSCATTIKDLERCI
jgi:hypothetical protein